MDSVLPLSGTMAETLPPYYQSVDGNLVGSGKTFMNKADSGITYNIPDNRKRPRDSINEFNVYPIRQKSNKISEALPSFLDQDIILQAHQQQSEMDRFLTHHVILHS